MKIIIAILIFTIGVLLYFLFSNVYELYIKKHPAPEDPMAFYNTYERKYAEENQSPRQTQTHIPKQVSTPKSSFPECFTILGFDKIPTEQELKKRFRELAKENHPDRGGDPVKFEEISKAHNDAMKLIKNM